MRKAGLNEPQNSEGYIVLYQYSFDHIEDDNEEGIKEFRYQHNLNSG